MSEDAVNGEAHAGLVIAEKYRLERELGRGGMGSVWRCEHLNLGSKVALKILHPAGFKRKNTRARFLREAKAAAMLRSTHVVQIMDHGTDGPFAYIVMEHLEGESLHRRLKRGPLDPDEAITILSHIARAISKAHERGIVHRDLKPDNIFLLSEEDEVLAKVLDFGIAKASIAELNQTGSPETQTGALLGTPYYMSPEQATGQKELIDHRSDLWALGVIAYESLLGHRPYQSDNLGELVLQICTRSQPVPSRKANVPPGLDDWFARANARDPEERFQNAKAMIRAFANVFNDAAPASGQRVQRPSGTGADGSAAANSALRPSGTAGEQAESDAAGAFLQTETSAEFKDVAADSRSEAAPASDGSGPNSASGDEQRHIHAQTAAGPDTLSAHERESEPLHLAAAQSTWSSRTGVVVLLAVVLALGLGFAALQNQDDVADAPSPAPSAKSAPNPSVAANPPHFSASSQAKPSQAKLNQDPPAPSTTAASAAGSPAGAPVPTTHQRTPQKIKVPRRKLPPPKPVPTKRKPKPSQDLDPLGIH